ncbi:MAG: molybdopterin-guanine dinucleotide biosynthesis protein B [Gammaproteobacteria bacterium]|nr:molybdopterin-guanine dinucleotide biosynthesis protein B [Gammaproteobacteria bacterium]
MKIKANKTPALIGFAAWSGTGKTTLLEKIIPLFREKGFRVAIIKHAHHDFDIDYPGKDSFRLRKAGAIDTIVASGKRWALIHENDLHQEEPDLNNLVTKLDLNSIDLILVEGFKHEHIPRIELRRSNTDKPLLYPEDKDIIAIATDSNDKIPHTIHQLNINDPAGIVNYIEHHFLL